MSTSTITWVPVSDHLPSLRNGLLMDVMDYTFECSRLTLAKLKTGEVLLGHFIEETSFFGSRNALEGPKIMFRVYSYQFTRRHHDISIDCISEWADASGLGTNRCKNDVDM